MKKIGVNVVLALGLFAQLVIAGLPEVAKPLSRAAIEAGLRSHDKALFIKGGWIRDPYIVIGPDNQYYLTGTTANEGDEREHTDPYNMGLRKHSIVGTQVRIWRSHDLVDWEYLGAPYNLADNGYSEKMKKSRRLWAPELHWLGDRWALVHCPKRTATLALAAPGLEIKGPWVHPMGANIGVRHDPSLHQEKDGAWYMLSGNTSVQKLSADFESYASSLTRIDPAGSRPGPEGKPISYIGHEGATVRKIGQKYVHFGTAWSTDSLRKGSYNLYYSTSDKLEGPYGPRKFVGRFLGHGTPFQTRDGKWWNTAFYNANVPPISKEGIAARDLREEALTINQRGTTIVPLEVKILQDGDIYIRAKDPDYANPGPDEAQRFDLSPPKS